MNEIVKEKTKIFLNVSLPWVFHPTKIYLTQCLMVTWESWGTPRSHLELNICQETNGNIKHRASKLRTSHPSHLWRWLLWSRRHPQTIVFQPMRYNISTTACTGAVWPLLRHIQVSLTECDKEGNFKEEWHATRTRHCPVSTNHGNLALHQHSADKCI